mmetsp:Transcript_12491/g.12251  ORF Transcript_12491/g.12251 Transcript_12491/m.12251 type:complete len:83 (+) Transcript_12491:1046-1294(+)
MPAIVIFGDIWPPFDFWLSRFPLHLLLSFSLQISFWLSRAKEPIQVPYRFLLIHFCLLLASLSFTAFKVNRDSNLLVGKRMG